jgi:hypothetical protein
MRDRIESPSGAEPKRDSWERWRNRLKQLPDGTWFNPEGVEDESFFRTVEEVRHEVWMPRGITLKGGRGATTKDYPELRQLTSESLPLTNRKKRKDG